MSRTICVCLAAAIALWGQPAFAGCVERQVTDAKGETRTVSIPVPEADVAEYRASGYRPVACKPADPRSYRALCDISRRGNSGLQRYLTGVFGVSLT